MSWLFAILTVPPSIPTATTDELTPLFDRFTQLLSDGWDFIAPWLTLAVAVRLVWWWLSWRAGSKSPGSEG